MSRLAPDWGGLVLFRRAGEEIVIRAGNYEVLIVVQAAGGGRAQLRIIADSGVQIWRGEVLSQGNGEEKENGK